MGRAILIICAGVLLGLSYTFFGMNNRSLSMTQGNVNSYKAIKAKNMAQTGVQLAIEEYNDRKSDKEDTNDEFKNVTRNIDDTNLTLSLDERVEMIDDESTDVIVITSTSNYQGTEHKTVATFDVSENQQLVPTFKSALDLTHELFSFSQSGSSSISGIASHCKQHAPGVSVLSKKSKEKIEGNSNGQAGGKKGGGNNNGGNYGSQKGISGNPPIARDQTLSFGKAAELIEMLEAANGIKYIDGNYKGSLGTPKNPGVFFVDKDEYVKLSGGIGNGYGIIVVKEGAILDLKGNVKFNGLVLFEDGIKLDGAGTPVINGSVVVGSPSNLPVNIDITGNIHLQYDCDSKKYADLSINNLLNTTLYQELSIYE